MPNVNDTIVTAYFEALGFYVRRPRKYQIAARGRHHQLDCVDLLVTRPNHDDTDLPVHLKWKNDDLKGITRAAVAIRGWHTDRFSPAVFQQNKELLRLGSTDLVTPLEEELGKGPVCRILCLSNLPASPDLEQETLTFLQQNGIDGVLVFPTMLRELIRRVETQKNYEKSELLQTLRILKAYELFRSEQLDLFAAKKRKTE